MTSEQPAEKIYVREAMTRNTKTLLYESKQRLKTPNGHFKYVWCKAGKVYAKVSDDSKDVNVIRSLQDIEPILRKSHYINNKHNI